MANYYSHVEVKYAINETVQYTSFKQNIVWQSNQRLPGACSVLEA